MKICWVLSTERVGNNCSDPLRKAVAKDLEQRDEAAAAIKGEQIVRNLYMIEVLTYVELHLQEVEVRLDVLRMCS